jgi:hypothetical protein
MTVKKPNRRPTAPLVQSQPTVVWDEENVHNAYANVFNVAGSQEEFVLSLGMNPSWSSGQKELKVQLTNRIMMSPFTAKRLAKLLNGVVQKFESRYGTLQIETTRQDTAPSPKNESQDSRATSGRVSKTGG